MGKEITSEVPDIYEGLTQHIFPHTASGGKTWCYQGGIGDVFSNLGIWREDSDRGFELKCTECHLVIESRK
jgi:hypothetical protein